MLMYLKALRQIRETGIDKTDRTGVGTRSLFGDIEMSFSLQHWADDGLTCSPVVPLLTTKRVNIDAIKKELKWMLDGLTNVRPLQEQGVKIWNEWAAENGELGPVYGHQWRRWPDTRVVMESDWLANQDIYEQRGFRAIDRVSIDVDCVGVAIHRTVDQIAQIEHQLRNSPDSRRIILSGWNVAAIEEMALPPCHTLAQWAVRTEEGKQILDCKLYQRSGDFFLGIPFNIVQYALLTHMFAKANGMIAGRLFHTTGDAHIYSNHFAQVDEQLSRHPSFEPAYLHIDGEYKSVLDIPTSAISVSNYNPQPFIPAPVAV